MLQVFLGFFIGISLETSKERSPGGILIRLSHYRAPPHFSKPECNPVEEANFSCSLHPGSHSFTNKPYRIVRSEQTQTKDQDLHLLAEKKDNVVLKFLCFDAKIDPQPNGKCPILKSACLISWKYYVPEDTACALNMNLWMFANMNLWLFAKLDPITSTIIH